MFQFGKVLLAGILVLLICTLGRSAVQADSGSVTDCNQFNDANAADGKDTLGELLPGGGTIKFQCGGRITLPVGVQIDITVVTTLNGNGNPVEIAGNQSRVFQVHSGAWLTLISMNVIGGYTTGSGGGILISENGGVDLYSTIVFNNDAPYGRGGGIYVEHGAALAVYSSSQIDSNSAESGGGIYINSGGVVLNNSTVSNNTAAGNGGGIAYVDGTAFGQTGSLTLNNSIIRNNQAPNGGAIYNDNGSTMILSSTSVYSNNASYGGALYFVHEASRATIQDTAIEDNQAAYGGGIYNVSGILTISGGSDLIENTAAGGAGLWTTGGTVTFSGGTIMSNIASDMGGAMAVENSGIVTIADGMMLALNHANTKGGGIYNNTGIVTVDRSTLVNNSAGTDGGGIYSRGGSLRIQHSTLVGNGVPLSSGDGGGIFQQSNTLTVINSTFSQNEAQYGGGIYNFSSDATILNSTLYGNFAASLGGGIYDDSANGVTTKNTIVANSTGGSNCNGFFFGHSNLSTDSSCGPGLHNVESGLGPLQHNGGLTATYLPAWDSPAVDGGSNDVCDDISTVKGLDQRGQSRPIDGNGDGLVACDIGAVERHAAPTMSITNRVGFESHTAKLTFVVTRSQPTTEISTVHYATADGTATAGSDYIATDGTLTFAEGVTTQQIVVTLRGDAVVEGNETFFVNLTGATNAGITDNQGQGTIRNSTVTLSAPANNAFSHDNTPVFSWVAVNTATQYQLQVATNATFTSLVIDETLSTTRFTPGTALTDRVYYWRVRASDGSNWGAWCVRWMITIDTIAPARPVLASPENGASSADNTPTFSWQAVNGALRYTLQVDDNVDFSSPIIDRSLTTTSFAQPNGLPDKRYYWHVQAQDNAGNVGAWSARWSFVVNAVPLARPTNTSTSTPVLTATMTASPTATATATATHTLVPTATLVPTDLPTATPVPTDTLLPTDQPTSTPVPTETPTEVPSEMPTEVPTETPTETPTVVPTSKPTETPADLPTEESTEAAG